MKINRVSRDMDGVLADFDRGVRELAEAEPLPMNGPRREADDDRMWEAIRRVPHFYARLQPMPGARAFFEALSGEFGGNCQILTGIPKPKRGIPEAAEDKREWARRELSPEVVVHIVFREQKRELCGGPDCVLIDDSARNIDQWTEAGGTGIVFTDAPSALAALRALQEA